MKFFAQLLTIFISFSQYAANAGTTASTDAASIKLEATYASIKANIIDAKCIKCHSADGKADALPYETKNQLIDGTLDSGDRVIIPGQALKSPFFQAMNQDANLRGDVKLMPPKKAIDAGTVQAVTADELRIVEAWINAGATN